MYGFRFVGWIEIARVSRTIPRDLHDDSVLVRAREVVVSARLRVDAAGRKLFEGFRIETVAISMSQRWRTCSATRIRIPSIELSERGKGRHPPS